MRGLALEDPERAGGRRGRSMTASTRVDAESADQLVLEVVDAGEEAEASRSAGSRLGRTRPGQAAVHEALLGGVVQPGQAYAEAVRAEQLEVAGDVRRATGGRHQDPLGRQVAAEPRRDGEDGRLVARTLDEHHGAGGWPGAGHAG